MLTDFTVRSWDDKTIVGEFDSGKFCSICIEVGPG